MEAVGRKETALKEKPTKKEPKPAKEAKTTVINPDGVETEVAVEDDARLEDLVFEAFKTWIVDCDTDEHLDSFLGMNKEAIKVLEKSDRWDEFCELGKRQRVRIKQGTKGDTDE